MRLFYEHYGLNFIIIKVMNTKNYYVETSWALGLGVAIIKLGRRHPTNQRGLKVRNVVNYVSMCT